MAGLTRVDGTVNTKKLSSELNRMSATMTGRMSFEDLHAWQGLLQVATMESQGIDEGLWSKTLSNPALMRSISRLTVNGTGLAPDAIRCMQTSYFRVLAFGLRNEFLSGNQVLNLTVGESGRTRNTRHFKASIKSDPAARANPFKRMATRMASTIRANTSSLLNCDFDGITKKDFKSLAQRTERSGALQTDSNYLLAQLIHDALIAQDRSADVRTRFAALTASGYGEEQSDSLVDALSRSQRTGEHGTLLNTLRIYGLVPGEPTGCVKSAPDCDLLELPIIESIPEGGRSAVERMRLTEIKKYLAAKLAQSSASQNERDPVAGAEDGQAPNIGRIKTIAQACKRFVASFKRALGRLFGTGQP